MSYKKISTLYGEFTINTKGNSKVQFPIINLDSGTHCSSAKWCPFSLENYKQSGRKLCFAVKAERLYKDALKTRVINNKIIMKSSTEDLLDLALEIVAILKHKRTWKYGRIVRLNESGDINKYNIQFVEILTKLLKAEGIKVYLYSKAPYSIRKKAINAGVTVLHSEHDFVAIKKGEKTKLPICPGVCGPCLRCPQGKKSAVIEH